MAEAIRLDPSYPGGYLDRGNVYYAKGDYDRAIADFTAAIRLDPRRANAYRVRGLAHLHAGALPKALADFTKASALNPRDAYVALWLDIVNRRSNLPSRLAEATDSIDMTRWPAPVIRFYLGQLTPEGLLAAADDADPSTKNGQVCEANFYSGERALQRGDKGAATRLFRLAAADCPKDFNEHDAAVAELRTLGATP